MRKYLTGLAVLFILTTVVVVGRAFGNAFTDNAPTVTCQQVSIDPATWVTVTFHGMIGTTAVSITVDYNSTTHAVADIGPYTTATGPIPYSLTATGNFGPYGVHDSLTATGTLDCHEPATTTTTATTSTTVPVTTSTECPDHTLPCAGPPITDAPTTTFRIGTPATVSPTTTPKQLPFTGSTTGSLGVIGGGLTLLGATALAIVKHRRSA